MNNVSMLFSELAEIENEMESLELGDQVRVLNSLDAHHNRVWEDILTYEPVSEEAAELMFLMLLNKLCERAERSEATVEVKEKLIALFQANASRVSAPCAHSPRRSRMIKRN